MLDKTEIGKKWVFIDLNLVNPNKISTTTNKSNTDLMKLTNLTNDFSADV